MSKKEMLLDSSINLSIFALFLIPFLITANYFPVSKFYSEALALTISGLIAVLAIYRSERICISHISIASILFALFLLLQIPILKVRFPGVNLIVAMEFLVGCALSIGIASYINGKEELQKKLVLAIAYAASIGGIIQGIFGFLQFTGLAENEFLRTFILFNGTDGLSIFGNLGQRNNYVNFVTVGVFAWTYLYFIRRINLSVYLIFVTLLLTIMSVTMSRTIFLYYGFAIIVALIFNYKNRGTTNDSKINDNKRALMLVTLLFAGLFIIELIFPKLVAFLSDRNDVMSGVERLASNIDQTTYRRFYEWYKCLVIFASHPIFGIGWYQYPKEAIYLMLTDVRFSYIPGNVALYTHSHNSPLNILAETGIIGFAISMVYGFGYGLYIMFKKFNNHATLFLSFMILTIFGQGLLEYPLWYAYFLMIFILMLSVSPPVCVFNNNRLIKAASNFIFIIFAGFCAFNVPTYNKLVTYTVVPSDSDDFANNVLDLEKIINTSLVWKLPALMVLDSYNMPGSPLINSAMMPQNQLMYTDMLASELPYPGIIFKQLVFHKLIGDDKNALFYANLLAHAYPRFKDEFVKQLSSDPRFIAEIEMMESFKYEDRSIFKKIFAKDN